MAGFLARCEYRICVLVLCCNLASGKIETQESTGKNPHSPTDAMEAHLASIAGRSATNCGIVFIPLRDFDHRAILAASDCAEMALSEKKPFHVFYIIYGIDGIGFIGLAMGKDGIVYELSLATVMQRGRMLYPDPTSGVTPCPVPVRLERFPNGQLVCTAGPAPASPSSSKDTSDSVAVATAQTTAPAQITSIVGSATAIEVEHPPLSADINGNHASLRSENKVGVGPCTGPTGIASIPPEVFDALMLATKLPNPREASKKAIEIASQPGSGLNVVGLLRDDDGTIIQYAIVVASAPKCTVYATVFNSERHFIPQSSIPEPATPVSLIDEFLGRSLGDAHGISYSSAPSGKGAVFSRALDSRIEYRNLPREGTLEWKVLIGTGYHYENYVLHKNDPCAVLFSSDVSGGDVTWPGTTRLTLCKNGDITLDMAEKKYNAPHQFIKAAGTSFRFDEWHMVSISFGTQGQAIWLDGAVVGQDPNHQQWLGAAGNHQAPVDVPTIGQTASGFWAPHQYVGGFEGTVGRFRASSKQQDWLLSMTPSQIGPAQNELAPNGSGMGMSVGNEPASNVTAPMITSAGLGFGVVDKLGFGTSNAGGLYKVGDNVSEPVALNKVEAIYSDQARRAKYMGVCLISLVVDAQGNPQNPHVIRALGMGLDEKALEAVRRYRFKPALKDGKTPVPVMITVEVNFRLYVPTEIRRPDMMDELLRSIAGKHAKNCGAVAYQPTVKEQKEVSAANLCAQNTLLEKKPFYVRYINNLPTSETHLIDGFSSFGLAMDGNNAMSAVTSRAGPDGQNQNTIVACPKPNQLTMSHSGGLTCETHSGADTSGVPNGPANTQEVSYWISLNGADLGIEGALSDNESTGEGIYKVGGNVSPPQLQQKVLAVYSEEARRADVQGSCVILLIVDTQGNVQKPRIVRSLGMGLDENALKAVRNWKFKPAMKDGNPVPVMIFVKVSFGLSMPDR